MLFEVLIAVRGITVRGQPSEDSHASDGALCTESSIAEARNGVKNGTSARQRFRVYRFAVDPARQCVATEGLSAHRLLPSSCTVVP